MKANRHTAKKIFNLVIACTLLSGVVSAQEPPIEKISHAEPLYIDLVRDLGARKGEREINLAGEMNAAGSYNEYGLLAEYEFAPVNRLGLEVETDFSFFKADKESSEAIPGNRLDCLRLSAQYSFLVAPKAGLTLALGYTQIFSLTSFRNYGKESLMKEIGYNPFFVAAKRWGSRFHSLVFISPLLMQQEGGVKTFHWQVNAAIHYSIPQAHSLVGIEINEESYPGVFSLVARPQVKVTLSKRLAVGLVAGIPLSGSTGAGSFCRIIYEP